MNAMKFYRNTRSHPHPLCAIPPAKSDRVTVFQADSRFEPVTMLDIEDLLDASINMRPLEKRDYFYSNGVDYENVVRYHGKVRRLNAVYEHNDNDRFGVFKVLLGWLFMTRKNM